jgi:hypothetical protein
MLHGYANKTAQDLVPLTGGSMSERITILLFTHNITGEWVSGLPQEPDDDETTTFRDLAES